MARKKNEKSEDGIDEVDEIVEPVVVEPEVTPAIVEAKEKSKTVVIGKQSFAF